MRAEGNQSTEDSIPEEMKLTEWAMPCGAIISLSFTHAHDHKAISEGKMSVQRAIPLDSFDWLRDQLRQLS